MKHPQTGKETLDRDWASAMYEGGKLYYAADCNHGDNKRLGLVCSLCSEAVFLAKGEILRPTWKHYRVTTESKYCDRRALTKEGKDALEKLQPKATRQRLKLFNRRFWDIFCFEKHLPRNPRKACESINFVMATGYKTREALDKDLDYMVTHCRDRWDVEAILKTLPEQIKVLTDPNKSFDAFLEHPSVKDLVEAQPDLVLETFDSLMAFDFSVLRHKILSEVITWLPTTTAKESFAKLAYVSMLDCLQSFQPPIRSNQVAIMMVNSLVLTDWERAIASLTDKDAAIGFG